MNLKNPEYESRIRLTDTAGCESGEARQARPI
jgi:hypothetical protein